jgi:GrpB-like predicted nucleotidyltransferase (UPF0157 family)
MDRRPIVVTDYDPIWPQRFEMLRAHVWPAVSDFALRVQHVGSTAVPGLAAKPIIDMSIVLRSETEVPLAIERLAGLDYRHLGNLDIEGREAFRAPASLPPHNLYVCHEGSIGLVNQVAVRDYLRTHPEVARRYGALKKQLAEQFPDDMESYIFGKTDLILEILREVGFDQDTLAKIEGVNRRS